MPTTTATITPAWRNNPDLKAATVARMRAHRTADDIVQGTYGRLINGDQPTRFVGCFHGCLTVEALAEERDSSPIQIVSDLYGSDLHREGERLWGIPVRLGALLDATFERQPEGEHGDFAVAVTEAIPVGADLSQVVDRWRLDLLADPEHGVHRHAAEGSQVRSAIDAMVGLYRRRLAGDEPTGGEWTTVREECWAARRAAAYAAAAAACAAACDAAYAATDAARRWQAQQLIHHITTAPIPAPAT